MTKQTAVEWLSEIDKVRAITIEEWEKAKAMEKEQIVNAWIDDSFPLDKEWVKQCAEQYYNETYGGNKCQI
jgi:hypothetical protein